MRKKVGAIWLALLAVVLVFASVLTGDLNQAHAQVAPGPATAEAPKPVEDAFGRGTPRGTVEGYIKAISEGDYERAARFLDVNNVPLGDRQREGARLALQLKQLLDRGGIIFDINQLSSDAAGKSGDDLELNLDQVGVLDNSLRKVPLLLERVSGPNNSQIWQVAQQTLSRVPFLLRISQEGLLDRYLPEQLKTSKIGNVATGHWIAIGVAAFFSLAIGYLISRILITVLRRILKSRGYESKRGILASMVIPLGLVFGVSLYRVVVVLIGIQLVARENINWIATILSLMALAWLGMRIVDGLGDVVRYSMSRTNRLTSVAVVMLARRIAKGAILAVAAITILDILGVDVTTGLAALGIGGLALALGAQRTIENLVGSITVVADKPVRVGDFCKFGDVTGTVEDIGIRSTQIRTLDRTIVTVPNGAFASMQIENFAVRDQFLFRTDLTMRYETTPAQLRFLLKRIRELLVSHERVNNDPARVRLVGLNAHSIDIEIFCYIRSIDYSEYLEVREDLLLRIMDIVDESGAGFAFPSQTIYFARDEEPSPEKADEIETVVDTLKKESDAPLSRMSQKQIAELSNTIPFPRED